MRQGRATLTWPGRSASAVCLLAGAMGLGVEPALAQGRPEPADAAFLQAVRAQNARHLDRSVAWPKQHPTPVLDGTNESEAGPKAAEIGKGPLLVRIDLKRGHRQGDERTRLPVLSVSVAGRTVATLTGAEAGFTAPPYLVQIAEMDTSNPYPEVVFSTFTGGAHCCSDTRIVVIGADAKRWSAVKAGAFDGDMMRAQDLDGDGRYELAHGDDRFLYAFACYACSFSPLRVLRLEGVRMVDVGGEPRYRRAHQAWLKMLLGFAEPGLDRNGFLAGYVAQKIRLGEGEEAWALMLEHYDRESDWGLETCPAGYDQRGACKGKTVKLGFPHALKRFLIETGYTPP